ncbi:hypothetical protein SODALDRAFT_192036 [Sodiomyces alkalinus F11]|uniref:Uncharacterized protein n=1 Tax=Sodiomyces alkalinus (strain CBS 110278 / VKM F-3762 / F11) TaxID=1314773 RepID=A0A3N2PRU8_SODAK|nr:hypothetical protein SODALDRAFT_192036 [Sodiomyces alkalinus F11]ROT37225.1 hypothetical protein SODALDRAFT_192036 [Sodiomyces alkalinus F11]
MDELRQGKNQPKGPAKPSITTAGGHEMNNLLFSSLARSSRLHLLLHDGEPLLVGETRRMRRAVLGVGVGRVDEAPLVNGTFIYCLGLALALGIGLLLLVPTLAIAAAVLVRLFRRRVRLGPGGGVGVVGAGGLDDGELFNSLRDLVYSFGSRRLGRERLTIWNRRGHGGGGVGGRGVASLR